MYNKERSDEPDVDEIIDVMLNHYDADRVTVTKLSAPWTKEVQEFLDKNNLILVGSIDKGDQSVIALADSLVIELYR